MKKFTRILAMALIVCTLCSVMILSADAAGVVRQNMSSSAVTCNASSGNLPASVSTGTGGNSYYFNIQVSSDIKLKSATLYIRQPGSSSYSAVHTDTATNYLRYTSYKYTLPNTAGTLYYYWTLRYTSGSTCRTSASSVTVKTASVVRQNVSASAASCNASSGNLPTSASSLTGGNSYYFNIQVSSDLKLKSVTLYVKQPGDSSYSAVKTDTASNYMRYTSYKYTVKNTSGTLYYYWKLNFTGGTSYSGWTTCYTSAASVKVTASSSNSNSGSNSTTVTGTNIISASELSRAASVYGISSGSNAYKALQSINSYYGAKLTSSQRKGVLVFFFEGCGNNSSSSARMNAMCVVVKNGSIVYLNRNSTTIPDRPFSPASNDNTAVPTVVSGIYTFTTVNHHGSYAALHITSASVVRHNSKSSYYRSTSSAINIHMRSSNTNTTSSSTYANSAGCLLVGSANGISSSRFATEYASFIQSVGIVAAGQTSRTTYRTSVSGKLIVDRTYASSYLSSIGYSSGAISMLGTRG